MLRDSEMARQGVSLELLGCWGLRVDGARVELPAREQRLAALVALRGTRPRAHLAGTLWPETTDERARSSLRASVMRLNRFAPGLIEVDRQTVGLAPGVRVDVHEVVRAVELVGQDPLGDLAAVSMILRGHDVLPGWYDDWVLYERGRLQQLRIQSLEGIAEAALDRGDCSLALAASREAIASEPLLESALAVTIRALLLSGNRSAAMWEFHRYRTRLARELRIEPSPELVALVRPLFGGGGDAKRRDAAARPTKVARRHATVTSWGRSWAGADYKTSVGSSSPDSLVRPALVSATDAESSPASRIPLARRRSLDVRTIG